MTRNEIDIPPEIQHLIDERRNIWSDLEAAQVSAGRFNETVQQVVIGDGPTGEITAPLTKSGNPSDELQAVVGEINQKLQQINQHQRDIQATNSQIESIKKNAQQTTITLVIAVVAVLGIAACVLTTCAASLAL